jgi:lysophospholipase L1-like esterase
MLGTLVMRLIQPLLEPGKRHRRSEFDALPRLDCDVLFIGDSITEGGLWNEWFPQITTANRGIAGETSGEVAKRLETFDGQARLVFLLIGTNDLALGVRQTEIVANVRRILHRLGTVMPDARVVVQSVTPRESQWRPAIESLNVSLRDESANMGATYLELWPSLGGADGAIDPRYSFDRLHLNGEGYRAWVESISPLIAETVRQADPGTLPSP